MYADGKILICRGMAHPIGVYSLALKTEDEIKKLREAAEASKTAAAASAFSPTSCTHHSDVSAHYISPLGIEGKLVE